MSSSGGGYVTHTSYCGDDGVQQLDDTIFSSHQRGRFIIECEGGIRCRTFETLVCIIGLQFFSFAVMHLWEATGTSTLIHLILLGRHTAMCSAGSR
jgi:hypothetical protein